MWCVVANVRPEAWGNASSPGTKHFRAGALVWIANRRWERVDVVGRHRVSKRLIAIIEETGRFTNWRVKEAYHPGVLAKLRQQPRAWETKEHCEAAVRWFDKQYPSIVDLPGEIERHRHALALLEADDRGRVLDAQASAALGAWTPQLRNTDRTPPHEVQVLADWLEDRGVPIALAELVRTLDRRRKL